jgi:DNA polymerase-3 subunit epsilon
MTLRPIFYDTETTGVKSEKDYIVEIAAYDPLENKTFEKLVKPPLPIPKEASDIHGITNEMVEEAPHFGIVGEEFKTFCEGEVVLIAHNNDGFDIHFLNAEFKRHNLLMPEWKFLDSLKWARKYRPDLPKHSLQFLRELYGFEANNAHRALDDVIILYKVFSAMTDDLPLETIMSLICKPVDLQHMPFGKYQGTPLSQVPKDYIDWLLKSGSFEKPDNKELYLKFKSLGLIKSEVLF